MSSCGVQLSAVRRKNNSLQWLVACWISGGSDLASHVWFCVNSSIREARAVTRSLRSLKVLSMVLNRLFPVFPVDVFLKAVDSFRHYSIDDGLSSVACGETGERLWKGEEEIQLLAQTLFSERPKADS